MADRYSFGASSRGAQTPNFGGPLGSAEFGVPASGGGRPGDGNGQNGPVLVPNTRAGNMADGVPYSLVPCWPPFVRVANDRHIVYFPRQRTFTFGGNGVAAGVQSPVTLTFSLPTIVVWRTAAAILADGADLPVGRNSLDIFKTQFVRSGASQDLIDVGTTGTSTLTLGSALCGPAGFPAFFQGTGLFFDVGSQLQVACQTLIANAEVHITIGCFEEFGPGRA